VSLFGRRAATVSVLTHARSQQSSDALRCLLQVAAEQGVELWFTEDEAHKHDLEAAPGLRVLPAWRRDADLCVALGGDGTILMALRQQIGTGVPVFAVNLGQVGFLATVEPEDQADGLVHAISGEFEVLELPALEATMPDGSVRAAINDISVHRKSGERVAALRYGIDGQEAGKVRCDGLVVATPAGSTGYNLANGGPVMAWGVEGYAVSFIAPHTMSARSLVVAPDGTLELHNDSDGAVDVAVDGRPSGELRSGETLHLRYGRDATRLAQTPGSSFYRRLREKFGRLAG
jgi:NAD+ kinase